MRGRMTIFGGLTAALLALTLWVSVPTTAAITGTITLTVSCASDPERTTITNGTDEALNLALVTLTSLVSPREGIEPFRLGGTLAAGASITYETDSGATSNVLTRQAIYTNADAAEGALLSTPFGQLRVLCSAGTGTLTLPQPTPVPPTATMVPPTATTAPSPAASPTVPATVPATATAAAPTATMMPPTATAVPTRAATATPAPTIAPVPTPTVVIPGMPNTGAGGGLGGTSAVLAALLLAVAGAAVGVLGRRRRASTW